MPKGGILSSNSKTGLNGRGHGKVGVRIGIRIGKKDEGDEKIKGREDERIEGLN